MYKSKNMMALMVSVLSDIIGGALSGVLWCCMLSHPEWDCVKCISISSLFDAILGYIIFMRSKS